MEKTMKKSTEISLYKRRNNFETCGDFFFKIRKNVHQIVSTFKIKSFELSEK